MVDQDGFIIPFRIPSARLTSSASGLNDRVEKPSGNHYFASSVYSKLGDLGVNSMRTIAEMVLVIFLGANLLFMIWLWYRARPGSGERMVLPMTILTSVAMLTGILPRVLWPHWEAVQISGSIVSIFLTGVVLISFLRRTRQRR